MIIGIVVSGGCGGSPKLKSGSAPADYRRPIYKLTIEGNTHFDDDTIIEGLVNRGSSGWWFWKSYRRFDPAELPSDAERIISFYKQNGYFTADVTKIKQERLIGGAVRITFFVDEGEPTLLDDVYIRFVDEPEGRFADATALLKKEISQETLVYSCCRYDTRVGDLFNHENYLVAKLRLRRFMRNQGYAYVKVTGKVTINRDTHTSQVEFRIDPGPKVVFGKTTIIGLKQLPASLVKNRISWSEGEVFSEAELQETQGQLLRLGRFSTVDVGLSSRNRALVADTTIRVAEQRLAELRTGGGAAFDALQWELRARAEYTRSNFFFDPLSSFKARFRPAYRWLRSGQSKSGPAGEGEIAVERNDFLIPLVTGRIALFYAVQRFESYTVTGPGIQIALRRPIWGDRIYARLGWTLANQSFSSLGDALEADEATQTRLGIAGNYRLGHYDASLTLDFRDNALSPRLGIYLSGDIKQASAYAGGLFDYTAGELDARGYVPLTRRIVAAARARYSRLLSGDSLPLTERYFAGGASSHRGFPQRRISPILGSNDAPSLIGGEVRVESSAELRFDILPILDDWFGVVTFLDAGDVGNFRNDVVLTNLHLAAGFGLRVGTPIGPIRADLGVRLNRMDDATISESGRVSFHLGIGEAF